MPRRRPPWFVNRDEASLKFAFFISHVAEDSAEVAELKAAIDSYSGRAGRQSLDCFLDVHNWPLGQLNTAVIREYLLKSAHMIAWISPAYLANDRGWIWMELAYAELIELSWNLTSFEPTFSYIVPVFRNLTIDRLERTPWLAYWQRQLVIPSQQHTIPEIARKLVDFYDQELHKREQARP